MKNTIQQTKRALGTDCLLTLVSPDEALARDLMSKLWTAIDAFEERFSRFRVSSELTHVNQSAGEPTKISPEFHAVMAETLTLARLTDGLFNPFVLPALQAAGYKGSWPAPDAPIDPALDVTNRRLAAIHELNLTPTTILIPRDAAIDLGGIGKGLMLDRLAALAEPLLAPAGTAPTSVRPLTGYWFSLGGDITAAGAAPDGAAWSIAIDGAPHLAVIAPAGARLAVATSGITGRHGTHAGRAWHHLIDPRTGRSADTNVLTATITATTATIADVLASCAVILGSAAASSFLSAHDATRAILQTAPGRFTEVAL